MLTSVRILGNNGYVIKNQTYLDLVALPVVDHAGHLAHVVLAEVHPPGPPVEVREVGAGPAHRGGVDDRSHRVEVVHQQPGKRYGQGLSAFKMRSAPYNPPVEERFIPILQRLEHFPLADVVWLDSTLDDLVLGLLHKESILDYSLLIPTITFSARAAQPSLYSAMMTSACSSWSNLKCDSISDGSQLILMSTSTVFIIIRLFSTCQIQNPGGAKTLLTQRFYRSWSGHRRRNMNHILNEIFSILRENIFITYVEGGTRPRMPSLSRSVRGKPRPLLNSGSLSRFLPVFRTISAWTRHLYPHHPHHDDGHLEELSPRHLAGDAPSLVHASAYTGAAGHNTLALIVHTVCTFAF